MGGRPAAARGLIARARRVRIAHALAGTPLPEVANGVRKFVHFMVQAQAALGHDVAVVALSHDPPPTIPQVRVRAFPPSRLPFRVPAALLAELEAWRPDVLHVHSPYYPPNVTLARWARRRRVPYVVTPHGALSPGEIRQRWYVKRPYKHLFELPTLNRAAFVHAVGTAEDLAAYGVTVPVVLAPCGIDPATVPRDLAPGALTERHPELRGRRVFLFLGRLDPAQKGLDLLVRAFAAARLDGAALVVVGPDYRRGRRSLERLLRRLRPSGPVVLREPVYGRERFEVLAGADVFVDTARWEGMPIAVLEAAALGRPCLLTPPADPLGRLSRAGGALAVEPRVESIMEALRELARMPAGELAAMGRRACEIATAEFSWSSSARILTRAYEAVLRMRSGSSERAR